MINDQTNDEFPHACLLRYKQEKKENLNHVYNGIKITVYCSWKNRGYKKFSIYFNWLSVTNFQNIIL